MVNMVMRTLRRRGTRVVVACLVALCASLNGLLFHNEINATTVVTVAIFAVCLAGLTGFGKMASP